MNMKISIFFCLKKIKKFYKKEGNKKDIDNNISRGIYFDIIIIFGMLIFIW